MKLLQWCKANAMPVIAVLAAAVTAVFVPPDADYLGYYDVKTLSCLLCVLAGGGGVGGGWCVGWLPIPVVHGMTLGELGLMVNGERWLPASRTCDLTVIPCKNYTHQTLYKLPIPPSPNLPNMKSIYLYPSTCYFEATPVSLGRGTDWPFQVYGHPNMKGYDFSFTPRSVPGAKNPPQLNKKCYGVDLTGLTDEEIWAKGLNLEYVIDAYRNLNLGDHFFRSFFEKLIGVDYVRRMIEEGKSADEIKAMWHDDVEKFREQRRPYLLYEE